MCCLLVSVCFAAWIMEKDRLRVGCLERKEGCGRSSGDIRASSRLALIDAGLSFLETSSEN